MKPLNLIPTLVLLLLAVTANGCQVEPGAPAGGSSAEVWSGFLEGETINVSAEVAGRLTSVAVQEGDQVQTGQLLAALGDDLVRLRIEAADATVAAAEAQLALLESGARAEDIRLAEIRVEQANVELTSANQVLTDAEAVRANPQMLQIMKAKTESQLEVARLLYAAALKQATAADLESRLWEDQVRLLWDGADVTLPDGTTRHFNAPSKRVAGAQEEWNKASHGAWKAWAEVDRAKANVETVEASLQDISGQLSNPIALDTVVDSRRAARERAVAGVEAAQAALQVLRDGTSPARIQEARAQLDQSRAARAALDQELAHYQVLAPRAGTVIRVMYHTGEVVGSGQPLVELRVAGDLTLTVFVPMSSLDQVRLDAPVKVWVDALDNQSLGGTVTHIADRAEFTGRQAQTDSERNAQLVAVEVTISRPDNRLKAGMPASVSFTNQSGEAAGAQKTAGETPAGALSYSGTLEAHQTSIAAEVEGRVVSVRVNQGDNVAKDEAVIDLDDTAIRSNLAEADAGVRAAQSSLDQVLARARPGEIALAEAGVMEANARLQAAKRALDDANRALASPQELTSEMHVWEGRVKSARSDITSAEAALSLLKAQVELAGNDQSMAGKYRLAILQRQQEATAENLLAAQADTRGAQRVVELYSRVLDNPLELLGAQHAAGDQVKLSEAGLKAAQAEKDVVMRGPQPEAIALAEALLRAAQANLKIVQARAKRFSISAPVGGAIVARNVEPGEVAQPGTSLLVIAEARELELTVFLPIRQLGAVWVGRVAGIRVPALGGGSFPGKVTYIAPEAEFKPANIYNSVERSEIVFAVRLTIPNPNGELKAGLPADVSWQ